MTEVLRTDYHPGAQPVRCDNGWLLATHPECSMDQLTLLIDAEGTDRSNAWNEQPDGTHRLLLMAASPSAQCITIAVPDAQPVTVRIKGITRVQLDRGEVDPQRRLSGFSYSVLLSHATSMS